MQEEDQLDSPSQEKVSPKKRGKWKAAESHLTQKRNEMDKAKVWHILLYHFDFSLTGLQMSDAVKRYSYLLGQTDLFKHFVDMKV